MTGHHTAAQAAPQPGAASPCVCWSCDRQCGGDTGAGSCGPLADLDGRPVCEACREAADVIDAEHAGAKVTLSQERVRLRADVWNPAASSLWLDARSARHLGLVLIARAAELDLAELADAADDTPGVPADSVIARHRDLGSAETLCGDRNLCARPYLHATGDHESFAGTVWAADGGPR